MAGSLFRPLGGYLADRFGGIKILILLYSFISTSTFLIGLLLPLPIATPLLFLSLTGLGMGIGFPTARVEVLCRVDPKHRTRK